MDLRFLFCQCKHTSPQTSGFLAKHLSHYTAAVFSVIKDKRHRQTFISGMRLFVRALSGPKLLCSVVSLSLFIFLPFFLFFFLLLLLTAHIHTSTPPTSCLHMEASRASKANVALWWEGTSAPLLGLGDTVCFHDLLQLHSSFASLTDDPSIPHYI